MQVEKFPDYGSMFSDKDVVCCALCQTPETPIYCDICHMNLCKDYILKHVSDSSKVPNLVAFKQYCATLNHRMFESSDKSM